MNSQNIKPLYKRMINALKNIVINIIMYFLEAIKQKWDNLSLLGQSLFMVFILIPILFFTFAIIVKAVNGQVPDFIVGGAKMSVFMLVVATLFWVSYMLETPQRRRKFYLILMTGLWLAFGYSHFFGEDPDIQYAMMVMAVVGSVWLIIPLFLSLFRPVVYHYHDDENE